MCWLLLPIVLAQVSTITPRDTPTAKPGTASIRGRVTAADTGAPLRRAVVSLLGPPSTPGTYGERNVATDGEGNFTFTRLRPGTYRVRVSPGWFRAQYLAVAYGGRRSSDPGVPIQLVDGQRFDGADVALPRGGAITGRVVDEFGEPVTRAAVYPSRAVPGGRPQRLGSSSQTDDLGRFRIYGLDSGDYIVTVEARGVGGPQVQGPSEGFAVTRFPSALSDREAGRVRVTAGADVGDVEIQLIRTRTFTVSGMVIDSAGQTVARPSVQLVRAERSEFSGFGVSIEQSGKFTIRDVVPGDYRLMVRSGWERPSETPAAPAPRVEYANVPVSVTSDIEGFMVVTQPGASITGKVVFEEGTPATVPTGFRVMTQPADRMMSMGPAGSGAVGPNLEFTLNDLFGAHYIRAGGPSPTYTLKAVMLGSTDITDTPIEFKAEHSKHLQVVFTARASTLEGTVTDEKGEPATDVTVLMIPEEKTSWRMGSPRMRVTPLAKPGQFSIPRVLPGRYFVIAVPRERVAFGGDQEPEYFEPLTREATTVVVAEDEKRTIDLRVAKGR